MEDICIYINAHAYILMYIRIYVRTYLLDLELNTIQLSSCQQLRDADRLEPTACSYGRGGFDGDCTTCSFEAVNAQQTGLAEILRTMHFAMEKST